jgi:hypothetical protein
MLLVNPKLLAGPLCPLSSNRNEGSHEDRRSISDFETEIKANWWITNDRGDG